MPTTLSIYFEAPFWVATLEHIHDGELLVARLVLGSEPSDAEVYEFVQTHFMNLWHALSDGIAINPKAAKHINPKRQQRLIKRELQSIGISSKAQTAMRLQIEANKKERSRSWREQDAEETAIKYQQKIEKRKQKKRGH